MTTELNNLWEVAEADKNGQKIEVFAAVRRAWIPWEGAVWHNGAKYRIAPKPPVTVKMLCYFTGNSLQWSLVAHPDWKRVPSEDKTIEVEM